MALTAHVGISRRIEDALQAGTEAAQHAAAKLTEAPHLFLVFASPAYNQEAVLRGVSTVAGDAIVAGGSSAGEISNIAQTTEHSVVVMALCAPQVTITTALSAPITENASRDAGKDVATQLANAAAASKRSLDFVMIFPDVLKGNGAEIVRGMLDVLDEDFPIVGGAPGDDQKFKQTYQYLNDAVYTECVVALGFSGDITLGAGVKHGWIPIGMPLSVTKSIDSTVHTINDKPAIETYKEYFGADNADLVDPQNATEHGYMLTYPLGMTINDRLVIRTPLTVKENGDIVCAAEVPENAEVRLMIGSEAEAHNAARAAAKKSLEALGGKKPAAAILFNCIARKNLFGPSASKEIEIIQEVLGKDTPLIGFYTYGEQAPIDGVSRHMKRCENAFHNQTVVICTLA